MLEGRPAHGASPDIPALWSCRLAIARRVSMRLDRPRQGRGSLPLAQGPSPQLALPHSPALRPVPSLGTGSVQAAGSPCRPADPGDDKMWPAPPFAENSRSGRLAAPRDRSLPGIAPRHLRALHRKTAPSPDRRNTDAMPTWRQGGLRHSCRFAIRRASATWHGPASRFAVLTPFGAGRFGSPLRSGRSRPISRP